MNHQVLGWILVALILIGQFAMAYYNTKVPVPGARGLIAVSWAVLSTMVVVVLWLLIRAFFFDGGI